MELKRRQRQVGAVLKEAIAEAINRHLDQTQFGLITVIDVIVSGNRAKVEIWVSALKNSNHLGEGLVVILPLITESIHHHIHLKRKLYVTFKVAN